MAKHSVSLLTPLRIVALGLGLGLLAGCGSPSSTPAAPTPAPPALTSPAPSSGQMQEETYQGCPPQGDGGDTDLNLRKNRIDTPGSYQSRSVDDVVSLPYPQGVERVRRSNWSSADAQAIDKYEGQAIEVEGYVLNIRHEGPESPNCHDQSARDYHSWIGAAPSSDPSARADSFIAELTPRVVALNPNWGSSTDILRLRGQHVRIAGWLMMDQEHPEQLRHTRGTLWEIHPITRIEVEQNGQWIDLASGNVHLGPASRSSSSGYSSGGASTSHHRSHRRRRS